jgi:hypothetical protein
VGPASEPWVFLVGRDGRVKAKFEGSVSEAELAAAIRAHARMRGIEREIGTNGASRNDKLLLSPR